jgi:hypothetical protein
MFFTDAKGFTYPISAIDNIGPARLDREATEDLGCKVWLYSVALREREERRTITEATYDDIMRAGRVVAAPAGTGIITAYFEEDEGTCWTDPVVAWTISTDGSPTAITLDGPASFGSEGDKAIVFPNGGVAEPGGGVWDSVDDFMTSAKARRKGKALAIAEATSDSRDAQAETIDEQQQPPSA